MTDFMDTALNYQPPSNIILKLTGELAVEQEKVVALMQQPSSGAHSV
jgi:hypothetical protein